MAYKIILAGEERSGKSSLLNSFMGQEFQPEYQPTTLRRELVNVNEDNRTTQLEVWDMSSRRDQQFLTNLGFDQTDVV